MTMTGDRVFLDTNIVLRYLNQELAEHEQVRKRVEQFSDDGDELWISRQIIREYLAQLTRPGFLAQLPAIDQVTTQIEGMKRLFQIADDTETVTRQLLNLVRRYPTGGKQVHDANIVATMLAYGIDTLLTLNVDDLKRFGDRIKIVSIDR